MANTRIALLENLQTRNKKIEEESHRLYRTYVQIVIINMLLFVYWLLCIYIQYRIYIEIFFIFHNFVVVVVSVIGNFAISTSAHHCGHVLQKFLHTREIGISVNCR